MSAEQRAELERQLAEDDQAGDESAEDFEVDWWEETPDGHRRGGRMPWSHAKRLYGQWAPDVFGEAPEPASGPQGTGKGAKRGKGAPAAGEPEGDEPEGDEPPAPAGAVKPAGSYFARRRPAAGQ